jgi:hypothetical protein
MPTKFLLDALPVMCMLFYTIPVIIIIYIYGQRDADAVWNQMFWEAGDYICAERVDSGKGMEHFILCGAGISGYARRLRPSVSASKLRFLHVAE